jgi:hypothetical protein
MRAGVFKSNDGGVTWKQVNSGLGEMDATASPSIRIILPSCTSRNGPGVDDGPEGEVKVLKSVDIPTGMGGIFLYAGTSMGLQRSPDCF